MLAIASGAGPALMAAALFGATTPLAKLLLQGMDPWMLAGVLYLGSGLGLAIVRIVRAIGGARAAERSLRGQDWLWLGASIAAGGVVAPVLLMMGLAKSSASAAALLLNLESVFTALLARVVFREHVGGRIAGGMACIVAGGVVLAAGRHPMTGESLGLAAIAAACLGWGIDNNLTRKVSATDPVFIAMLKGAVAGSTNVGIAGWLGAPWPAPGTLAAAGLVGFLGYGISLVLFIVALRGIGVARTAAYFSLGPFFGSAIAIVVLGDAVTAPLVVAAALMAGGLWLHLTERHEHEHEHLEARQEPPGAPGDAPGRAEPEFPAHRLATRKVRHRHPHFPGSEHRHDHRDA
jgi:drug/metabolite transporter (DMT)-like permease